MEILQLHKFGSEISTSFCVITKEPLTLPPYAAEMPFRLKGFIPNSRRVISLVGKYPKNILGRISPPERVQPYGEIWMAFKSAGLPVVPTVRWVNCDQIVMTDLTASGGVIYDKYAWIIAREHVRQPTPVDRVFKGIDLKDVEEKVKLVIEKANGAGISFPRDDPFNLLVLPDGRWDVYTIDIGWGRLNDSRSEEENKAGLVRFIDELQTLQRVL